MFNGLHKLLASIRQRPSPSGNSGRASAIPQVRTTYKLIFWIVAVLVLVALGFPYVVPFFY